MFENEEQKWAFIESLETLAFDLGTQADVAHGYVLSLPDSDIETMHVKNQMKNVEAHIRVVMGNIYRIIEEL